MCVCVLVCVCVCVCGRVAGITSSDNNSFSVILHVISDYEKAQAEASKVEDEVHR